MNYELAKKLKEAGFPQKGEGKWCLDEKTNGLHTEESLYVPTFSELIEACGERFMGISRKNEGESIWVALAKLKDDYDGEEGKTPEEAVANLWLKLNQRK